MKTGIMGDTFDPPHYAHLILAEQAKEQFHLDRMLLMPAGSPPHKPVRSGRASNMERLEMCTLAVSDNPEIDLCDMEMHLDGPSYTYRTLQMLHERFPGDEFYFIIGADSLFEFTQWREPQKICEQCTLLCAVRDNCGTEKLEEEMQRLKEIYGAVIYKIETPNMDISSAMLRQKIAEGHSVRYYLPDSVREYIARNRLYVSNADSF